MDDHYIPLTQVGGCLQQSFISNPSQQATMGMLSDKNNVSIITLGMLKFVWTNLKMMVTNLWRLFEKKKNLGSILIDKCS